MRYVLGWLRFICFLIGLPLAGWWLAGTIVANPPIVAPFLFASPFYAFMVVGSFWALPSYRYREKIRKHSSTPEIDGILGRYPELLGSFDGKVVFGKFEHWAMSQIVAWEGWLWVESGFWSSLDKPAREYAIVRAVIGRKRSTWDRIERQAFSTLFFLVGYVAASINLWFVIPAHTLWLGGMVWYGNTYGERLIEKDDAAALAVTNNLSGALRYFEKLSKGRDHDYDKRIDALKAAANA